MAIVLISGAGGYLGSVLVGHLLSNGHEIVAVDNFQHGENSLAAYCANPDFTVHNADCRDGAIMRPLLRKADVIIPLAAIVGASACNKDDIACWTTNFDAVKLICDNIGHDQRIITPTTNSGYGIGEPGVECTEDSPLRPLTSYGKSKVAAEEVVMKRKNSISLRLATVFGASHRMRMDLLVNQFVWRAFKDKAVIIFEGGFMRNYIAVGDVARAFSHAIDQFDTMKGQVYNVGLSDANLSKVELCQLIQKHVPDFVYLESEIGVDPDRRDYRVSNARIEATGWTPQRSVDDGVRELLKLYRTLSPMRYGNA